MEDSAQWPDAFNTLSALPRVFVTNFADLTCCQPSPTHRHPYYELVWVDGGEASLLVDFHRYTVQSGTMAFVASGQVHQWYADFSQTRILVIGFVLERLLNYGKIAQAVALLPFQDNAHAPVLPISAKSYPVFARLFDSLSARFASDGLTEEEVLMAYLNVILVELLRVYGAPAKVVSTDAPTTLTHSFYELVGEHFQDKRQVRAYANMLGVSLNHLVETVRSTSGKTPKQILQERLLLEAKRMLVHTQYTVAEISWRLDFKTPSYFGVWFKNLEGVTPAQFRQALTV